MTKQKLMRGRRSGVSSVVALVIVVLTALGAVAAIQIKLGHRTTVLGHVTTVTHRLHGHDWTNVAVLTTGIVLAVLGLLILLAGLLPARRSMLRLSEQEPNTIFAISRSGLARDLTAVATRVDGVESARVRVRRRRVKVKAASAMRDTDGLADSLRTALEKRVEAFGPSKGLRIRARITGSRD
jgi:hypothetical protein